MAEQGEQPIPKVGDILWGYPGRAGCSKFPVFLMVKKVTKTGLLSCLGLMSTKSEESRTPTSITWKETPVVQADIYRIYSGQDTVLVKPKESDGKLWLDCPSKKMSVQIWTGGAIDAIVDFGD